MDYSVLVYHINFHLEPFYQTPHGTSFTKLLDDWDKNYGYIYKYTKNKSNLLITTITTANDKRRLAPRYNQGNGIIDGLTT